MPYCSVRALAAWSRRHEFEADEYAGNFDPFRPAIAVLQFPDGVGWDGANVHVAIAVASATDQHVRILAQVANVITDPDRADQLRGATDPQVVLELLTPSTEEQVTTQ